MDYAKYVIIRGGLFGEKRAIIFDRNLSHELFQDNAITAGFVSFFKNENEYIEVKTFGKSESLGLSSKPEDAVLICHALNAFEQSLFIPEK